MISKKQIMSLILCSSIIASTAALADGGGFGAGLGAGLLTGAVMGTVVGSGPHYSHDRRYYYDDGRYYDDDGYYYGDRYYVRHGGRDDRALDRKDARIGKLEAKNEALTEKLAEKK
ncbi:MAG: hypothetical protein UU47_C0001G0098 [candidate division TM6 bacterium GW2011_GWE2_41_16]|nr:MAG: hypothetical protein UU47_C0001G0098 [candidate division TM6 bacterium GW2011_GWE2_41_16]